MTLPVHCALHKACLFGVRHIAGYHRALWYLLMFAWCAVLQGTAGHYGAYSCDIPIVTLDLLVDTILNLEPAPQFIVYTGTYDMSSCNCTWGGAKTQTVRMFSRCVYATTACVAWGGAKTHTVWVFSRCVYATMWHGVEQRPKLCGCSVGVCMQPQHVWHGVEQRPILCGCVHCPK